MLANASKKWACNKSSRSWKDQVPPQARAVALRCADRLTALCTWGPQNMIGKILFIEGDEHPPQNFSFSSSCKYRLNLSCRFNT